MGRSRMRGADDSLLDKPTGMVKQCVSVTPPLTLDDLAGMGNG